MIVGKYLYILKRKAKTYFKPKFTNSDQVCREYRKVGRSSEGSEVMEEGSGVGMRGYAGGEGERGSCLCVEVGENSIVAGRSSIFIH